MNPNQSDVYIIISAITLLFFGLAGFIVLFIIQYRKNQEINRLEKESMQAQHEQEILKTGLESQEQTMQTIAAELHDNIGQILSMSSFMIGSIELEKQGENDHKLQAAKELTLRSLAEIRQLSRILQGGQLINQGLANAIQFELDYLQRSGNITTELQCHNLPEKGIENTDLIVFRLFQEILSNAIKHAKATRISIQLSYQNELLQLQFADNGVGFDLAKTMQAKSGLGLKNLQKRAELIHATVSINSNEQGTCISIEVPYPANKL